MAHLDDEIGAVEWRKPISIALGPIVAAPHSGSGNADDGAEDQVQARDHERGDR